VRAGLSATALAGDTISVATVSRIEHGAIEPSLPTLRYLAGRLGCSLADLLLEDDLDTEARAALTEVEAWRLLGRPMAAWEAGRPAVAALEAEEQALPSRRLPETAPRRRLEWAVVQAQVALGAAASSALDPMIREARQVGDGWAVARLATARSTALDAETAISLLQAALAALPITADESLDHRVDRADLLLHLARRQETSGAGETARALYTQVVALSDVFQHPEVVAARLFDDAQRPRGAAPSTAPARPGSTVPVALPIRSAGLAIALTVAGTRLRRAAMLDLARLDLHARRLAEGARRLRQAQSATEVPADLPALGAFWSELDHWLERRPGGPTVRLADVAAQGLTADAYALAAGTLIHVEAALLAGRPMEAEQAGALLATSLVEEAPRVAGAIWLRLALAWAEAGNAPRAARALRAAMA
jgi:transcriptional regulator with XRE-family HTH domain